MKHQQPDLFETILALISVAVVLAPVIAAMLMQL